MKSNNTLTSKELGETFQEQQIERHKDPEKYRGLSFGHPDLDKLTGGARKTEFVVLAGAQKSGKTTTGLVWAMQFARGVQEGELVIFVSLEMSHSAIAARVMSNIADIDVTKFRDYKLEDSDWPKLAHGVAELSELPILWNVGAFTLQGLEAILKEYGKKVRVLIVDYFQLMSSSEDRRWEQMETLSRSLKRYAHQYDMTVVALTQQTREALQNATKRKDPNTMAGTQALARDCDLLIIILPYEEDGEDVPHMRKIYVALSRNSAYDVTFDAVFSGAFNRFGAPVTDDFAPMPEPRYEQSTYWENR